MEGAWKAHGRRMEDAWTTGEADVIFLAIGEG
jgi:hypothetical protein